MPCNYIYKKKTNEKVRRKLNQRISTRSCYTHYHCSFTSEGKNVITTL